MVSDSGYILTNAQILYNERYGIPRLKRHGVLVPSEMDTGIETNVALATVVTLLLSSGAEDFPSLN